MQLRTYIKPIEESGKNYLSKAVCDAWRAAPRFFMIGILAAALLAAPIPAAAAGWSWLIFLNDPASSASREINRLENIAQEGFVNITVMWYDKKAGRKTVYRITQDADAAKITSPVIETAKITGSSDINSEFSGFVVKHYLKDNAGGLIVTLYDRETAIDAKGAAASGEPGKWHGIHGLRAACEKIVAAVGKPIDILHFDADHFQCLEQLYELSDCAAHIIGSEERIPEAGTPYDAIVNPIIAQKVDSSHRFSFLFVSGWHAHFKKYARGSVKATLSAVKTAELAMVSEKLDTLLEYLTPALAEQKYREVFGASVIKRVRRYRDGEFMDAFDFGRLINEDLHEQNVEKGSREFLASLTNATVKNSAVGDLGKIPITYNSFGMSIYMPLPAPRFEGYDELAISRRTGWKRFLDYFYSFSLGKGYGN